MIEQFSIKTLWQKEVIDKLIEIYENNIYFPELDEFIRMVNEAKNVMKGQALESWLK